MDQPIILCGLGRLGQKVLEYLRAASFHVVVIDNRPRKVDPTWKGVSFIQGDFRDKDVQESAGIHQASGIIILASDDMTNIAATLMARAIRPDIRIIVRLFNQNLLDRLGHTIQNVYALSTSKLTAPILAMTALTGQGLGSFEMEREEKTWYQVAQMRIRAGSRLAGQQIGKAIDPERIQALAYQPLGKPVQLLLDVDLETPLQSGDRLVLCGKPADLSRILAGDEGGDVPHLLWAGWIRRQSRALIRTLAEVDRAVMLCTIVLMIVVVLSTLIFHLGVKKYTISDALFRTVSVMATISSMHEEDFQSGGMKVFVGALRIFGAALMAVFTAIVTNYLIRARLGGALEARRIPESGHVVVCGLSPVGFRVTEELIRSGERVVVVELAADNRFVMTARRLGAAVIIGDGTVAEVHRQARVGTARAVIAATNQDLVNLEIALLVRELNPIQRVILLQTDPQLAQMLREAADVRLAVSVPALAAPAFMAALFRDRILSVFFLDDQLLTVLDLRISDGDSLFTGQTIRTVAIDYRLLPLAVIPGGGQPVPRILSHRLEEGDRLIGVLTLKDLEQLLQRQPPKPNYTMEILTCPLGMQGWLAGFLRPLLDINGAEADRLAGELPLQLDRRLTRGQAEDLFAQLVRQRVTAKLVCLDSTDL